jgi:hypothetical protein
MKSTPDGSSPGAAPTPLEDLTFHPSPGPSVCVEVALLILDRESGDNATAAPLRTTESFLDTSLVTCRVRRR